jgi:hypothetical protein
MRKVALIFSLVAFMGLAFSPALMSSNGNDVVYSDTTKVVKKNKTKTKSDCSTKCGHSCTKTDNSKKSSCCDKKVN